MPTTRISGSGEIISKQSLLAITGSGKRAGQTLWVIVEMLGNGYVTKIKLLES